MTLDYTSEGPGEDYTDRLAPSAKSSKRSSEIFQASDTSLGGGSDKSHESDGKSGDESDEKSPESGIRYLETPDYNHPNYDGLYDTTPPRSPRKVNEKTRKVWKEYHEGRHDSAWSGESLPPPPSFDHLMDS